MSKPSIRKIKVNYDDVTANLIISEISATASDFFLREGLFQKFIVPYSACEKYILLSIFNIKNTLLQKPNLQNKQASRAKFLIKLTEKQPHFLRK